jgi:hypothetical protein
MGATIRYQRAALTKHTATGRLEQNTVCKSSPLHSIRRPLCQIPNKRQVDSEKFSKKIAIPNIPFCFGFEKES